MKMTLWLKDCVQKVLPKQVMSQEPSCLEVLVLACYAGKHSRVKELWKQLDSQTLVNSATNIELPYASIAPLPLTPVDALLIRLAMLAIDAGHYVWYFVYDVSIYQFIDIEQDLQLINFLQDVGSRASVYGLQEFFCSNGPADLVTLVNRGLIINGIDLTAINGIDLRSQFCDEARYASALEFYLETSLRDASSDLLLSELKWLVLAGAKISPFSEMVDPATPPPFASLNPSQRGLVALIWPEFQESADTWDAEPEYCSTHVRRNFAFQLCRACKEANWTRRRSLLLCCVWAVHNGREASQVQVRRVRRRLRGKQYWLDSEWLGFACCLSGNFQYRPAIARLILSFV